LWQRFSVVKSPQPPIFSGGVKLSPEQIALKSRIEEHAFATTQGDGY
jgi:hypothetical protein